MEPTTLPSRDFWKPEVHPPKGVTLVGRWHGMSGQGVAILESNDPKAMFELRAQWSDLLDLSITPCLEDADAGAVLAAMAKR
jgi:hypothetical protein